MKTKLLITFLLSTTLQCCLAQRFQQHIVIEESLNIFDRKVDSIVALKMNAYNIPGLSIGIVHNDSILFSKGYGLKNIKNNSLIKEYTNFHTASISKLLTAQAIMILVQKDMLSLDDKLVKIIPELKYKDNRVKNITVKSLLNHTSGLPDVLNYNWRNNNQSEKALEFYILDINLKLKSEPATEYDYSNLGYDILGYIIEKVSGANFDQFMKENILDIYGMSNSDFRYFKIADSTKSSPHSKSRVTKKIYPKKVYPYTREHAPGSTLNSSSIDLSNWMISFLKLLDSKNVEKTFNLMTEPSFESYTYSGLGFQLSSIDLKSAIGHYGGDKGYRSYLLMIPEENIGLVLLANCDYNEDFRQEIIHPIAKLMLNK